MTREMFVTVLYRLAGKPAPGYAEDEESSDAAEGTVPKSNVISWVLKDGVSVWANDAVLWAGFSAIVSGYPDGRFGPQDGITREQMALILYQYALYEGYDVSGTDNAKLLAFSDGADTGAWAQAALCWAVNAGIVNGNGDGTVNPQGEANRAQVAQIICNFSNWIA